MALEDKIRQLDEQICNLHGRLNTHGSIVSNLHSRVTELETRVTELEKAEKEKAKNPIYEITIEQAIEKATNEINKALKALHDELIK